MAFLKQQNPQLEGQPFYIDQNRGVLKLINFNLHDDLRCQSKILRYHMLNLIQLLVHWKPFLWVKKIQKKFFLFISTRKKNNTIICAEKCSLNKSTSLRKYYISKNLKSVVLQHCICNCHVVIVHFFFIIQGCIV